MVAHEYTISILFAGLTCCPPALGVATPLLIFAVIGLFCLFVGSYADPDTLALLERECSRNPCRNEMFAVSSARARAEWDRDKPDTDMLRVAEKELASSLLWSKDTAVRKRCAMVGPSAPFSSHSDSSLLKSEGISQTYQRARTKDES